jgi:hypothetical protein
MFAGSTDEERMWRVEMIERRGEEGLDSEEGFNWLWLLELVECAGRSGAGRDSVVGGEVGGVRGKRGEVSQTVG